MDLVTSCVVEHADVDLSILGKTRKISPNERIAVQALDEAIAKQGRKMADTENYPASRAVVSLNIWCSVFLKMRVDSGSKEASVKKDFIRHSTKLQKDGIVHCYDCNVWFVHNEDRQDI